MFLRINSLLWKEYREHLAEQRDLRSEGERKREGESERERKLECVLLRMCA